MNASRHRPAALRGLGLFVLSLPLTVALAQSLPQLEPVVVTATRLEQPVSAVLSDVRVIDAEIGRAHV